jgi:hypothetical protein
MREYLDPKESKRQEDGENGIMRNFVTCTFHEILFICDKIRKYERGRACRMYTDV